MRANLDSYSLLSKSRLISDLVEEAHQIAACDCKVLITGESGVGKELLARLIHERSPRSRRPLITINCGGVAETLLESELFGHLRGSFTDAHRDRRGLLEMADGGTVLLDEVGEMSLRMQTLLLRFLESGEIQQIGSEGKHTIVDVRVISATNRDLLERTREKEFREDLYYRLNVVHLVVPPLRARREDIRLLFEHYLRLMSGQHRLEPCEVTDEAMTYLEEHGWPGNVRELKNVAERVALRYAGRVVSLGELSRQVTDHEPVPAAVAPGPSPANLLATTCFERMTKKGETFTQVIHEPFMRHDLTRETVRSVVSMGLAHTHGSYRLLTELFNLTPSEYKRLLSFLKKHDCLVAFQHFRQITRPPVADAAARFVKVG
jgi:DNA-binding NtrC family response regulator